MEPESRWISKFELRPGKWVFIPTLAEMQYGRELIGKLSNYWILPRYYYHLREGGHVAALKSHVHHKYFCCLDIENFFESVSKNRVTRTLKEHLGYKTARETANRSTVKISTGGKTVLCLPFGFPQSPFLASLVLYKSHLGRILGEISRSADFKVSVYVDDILISSDSLIDLNRAFTDTVSAFERSLLSVNTKKLQPPSKSIISFNINLSHNNLSITDARMRDFALDYKTSDSTHKHKGIEGYIKSVNPNQINDLLHWLRVL